MQTILIISTSVMGIILSLYNAWIYAMSPNRDEYYNKLVHKASFAVRLTWTVLVIVTGILFDLPMDKIIYLALIAILWFWAGYNWVYNSFNHKSIFYVGSVRSGTKSFLDKTFGKLYVPGYIILIALVILWHPLHLYQFLSQTLIESLKIRWVDWTIAAMLAIFTTAIVLKFRKSK